MHGFVSVTLTVVFDLVCLCCVVVVCVVDIVVVCECGCVLYVCCLV